jgi:hypothetical protein
MPSVDPDWPVEITVESDPAKAGDQGRVAAEYCAADASGMSVNPCDDNVPNVERPKPGAALKESHEAGRNCSRTLNACSLRPPVKLMAPAVTPVENRNEPSSVRPAALSAGRGLEDCASPTLALKTTTVASVTPRIGRERICHIRLEANALRHGFVCDRFTPPSATASHG